MGNRTRLILVLMLGLIVLSVAEGAKEPSRVVPASEVLAKIQKDQPVEYDHVTITGDFDLSKLDLQSRYVPWTGTFRVISTRTEIEGRSEDKKIVRSHIRINDSKIDGSVDFSNTIIENSTNFGGTIFNSTADFSDSNFNSDVDFIFSKFNSKAQFINSKFNSTADFGDSNFNSDVYFLSTKFNSTADFSNSEFNSTAEFRYSDFKSYALFSYSRFKGKAFFFDTNFKLLDLTQTEYDKLYIRWNSNCKLWYDETAYQLLIENLKKLGFMTDADNCYYQFRVGQFLHQNPIEDPFMSIINLGAWIFYGFGKRPIYPFLWSIFVIGLFGAFWIAVSLLSPKDAITKYSLAQGRSRRAFSIFFIPLISIIWRVVGLEMTKRAIDEYDQVGNWPSKMREALSFSAAVFLSGTKLFVDPPAVPSLPGRSQSLIKRAFLFERLLGAFFSILLFLAIGATVVRS